MAKEIITLDTLGEFHNNVKDTYYCNFADIGNTENIISDTTTTSPKEYKIYITNIPSGVEPTMLFGWFRVNISGLKSSTSTADGYLQFITSYNGVYTHSICIGKYRVTTAATTTHLSSAMYASIYKDDGGYYIMIKREVSNVSFSQVKVAIYDMCVA